MPSEVANPVRTATSVRRATIDSGEGDETKGKTQQIIGTVKNAVRDIADTIKR